jgi:hypothetical protein
MPPRITLNVKMTAAKMSPKQEEEDEVVIKDIDSRSEEDEATAGATDATRKQSAKRRTKTGCMSKSMYHRLSTCLPLLTCCW